ncbi:hypothetical protein Tco_0211246 [Tanacetum coccineum]
MDKPNITMKEYIRLEEEKARRHGKMYNWETAKYGKIWYDEDVHDLRSVETEFQVFNDELSSEKTLFCEPTVSSLNKNEIDIRISFDESDDEDYMGRDEKKRLDHLKQDLRVGDEEVVVGEGVVVMSSSLDMLTNSCLGGIMNEVKENVIDEGIEKSS